MSAGFPASPVGIGYALAAYWQGSLTWWAFRADRPLRDYLADKLTVFIAMLGMSESPELDSLALGCRSSASIVEWLERCMGNAGSHPALLMDDDHDHH
ncbi:hypothetical protein [Glycomyces buryatensis]|uniref:Uncharacterized protein n=1 Tax=Glycomyces buryatensis TaxID=2570927 RepID=A0A4S8QFW9_9ACTN|nr:hypothetical protein [Glycomyces buryatensis]THV40229.1 hypothetical protein FAB82_16180 [Glycomyces buryatensis]